MSATFFFYDLETTGFSARSARIVQFAGQRTDMELNPVGEPVNELIRLSPDILPEPDAVLLTGITPQRTISDGLTEAEFLKYFYSQVVKPDTIFVGFNSVRFDDEFMRFLLYRNFYDAYEWHWKDSCSRWDILDLVRMTRALKPDGIKWPFASDGKPANRLEFLSKVNNLQHDHAHDALSDVMATIGIAKLIMQKQPKLFAHLLDTRSKQKVQAIVESGKPFMYTSGRYGSRHLHTTAAVLLGRHSDRGEALVYDLRFDPKPFLNMVVDELIEAWKYTKDPDAVRLPIKTLKYNRCPAVIPGVVQDTATLERLALTPKDIKQNLAVVTKNAQEFAAKLFAAKDKMDGIREQAQAELLGNQLTVDERLYEKFISDNDKKLMTQARSAKPETLSELGEKFVDERMKGILPLYKARNYPKSLTESERMVWDEYCQLKLFSGGHDSRMAKYFARLQELNKEKLSDEKRYIIEELRLYGESIMPADAEG
jgi:exodeoxyribonuclease-1